MIAIGMIIGAMLGFLLGFYTCTLMVMKDRRELKRIMETALKEYAKKKDKEADNADEL